ncbi:MAG: prolyl oligopeptidase family serine peptidase, partial [Planctomycetota bacterium]
PSGHRFRWHDSPAAIGVAHDSVVEAIDAATAQYSIRTDRIVIAGYGSGGTMAIRIAMRQPRLFAGAVSVGGHMPECSIKDYKELRGQKLRMLWQWGKDNPDYTPESLRRDCQTAMSIGSRVELRQYPGNDEMDTVVLSDLNRWAMNLILSGGQTSDDSNRSHPVVYSAN